MKHIVSLGFKETDADVLYKDKDNWIGASKGRVPFEFIRTSFYFKSFSEGKPGFESNIGTLKKSLK